MQHTDSWKSKINLIPSLYTLELNAEIRRCFSDDVCVATHPGALGFGKKGGWGGGGCQEVTKEKNINY